MRILYMGTPDFAVLPFRVLTENFDVVGVVTQPDKPKGRHMTLTPPAVKVAAMEKNIPVFQPTTLKDGAFQEVLDQLTPDVIVVVAYGKILPKYILDYPKYGCVNLHGSLLPKYRGAAPMQRALIDGEKETGVTTMCMAEGLDTGDMLEIATTPITEEDNFETIHDRLSEMGASLLLSTLHKLKEGSRIIDVVNTSGGLLETADVSNINLSKKICDEMTIYIKSNDVEDEVVEEDKQEVENNCPTEDNEEEKEEIKNDASIENEDKNNELIKDETEVRKISLNTATKEQLMTLSGIGEAKALDIIEYLK